MVLRILYSWIEKITIKGYYPENCRWVTAKENCNNTSYNRVIYYNGETKTLTQWCEELNIYYSKAASRLSSGWTIEDTFREGNKQRQEFNASDRRKKFKKIKELAEIINNSLCF